MPIKKKKFPRNVLYSHACGCILQPPDQTVGFSLRYQGLNKIYFDNRSEFTALFFFFLLQEF